MFSYFSSIIKLSAVSVNCGPTINPLTPNNFSQKHAFQLPFNLLRGRGISIKKKKKSLLSHHSIREMDFSVFYLKSIVSDQCCLVMKYIIRYYSPHSFQESESYVQIFKNRTSNTRRKGQVFLMFSFMATFNNISKRFSINSKNSLIVVML